MSRGRSMYPTDEAGRALLWRHRKVMHALEHGELRYQHAHRDRDGNIFPGFWPEDALVLVTRPDLWVNRDDTLGRLAGQLLDASIAAVREKAVA